MPETRADDTRILSRTQFCFEMRDLVDALRLADQDSIRYRIDQSDLAIRELLATLDREIAELKSDLGTSSLASDHWQEQVIALKSAIGFELGSTEQAIAALAAKDEEVRRLELERFTAENHRVGLMTILGVQGGTFADAVAAIEAKEEEIRRLREALGRIQRISCGEDQLEDHEALDDTECLGWIYRFASAALQPSPVQNWATDKESLQVQPAVQTCKTCGGSKQVMHVVKQYEDAYAEHSQLKFSDCPDCVALYSRL